jgi:hypothetical protein
VLNLLIADMDPQNGSAVAAETPTSRPKAAEQQADQVRCHLKLCAVLKAPKPSSTYSAKTQ